MSVSPRLGFRFASRDSRYSATRDSRDTRESKGDDEDPADADDAEEDKPLRSHVSGACSDAWPRLTVCCRHDVGAFTFIPQSSFSDEPSVSVKVIRAGECRVFRGFCCLS